MKIVNNDDLLRRIRSVKRTTSLHLSIDCTCIGLFRFN